MQPAHYTYRFSNGTVRAAALIKQILMWLSALLPFLFVATAQAAAPEEVRLIATVDRDQVALDEYIVLTLSVEGAREEPEIPDMPAFKVQSRGSSSQISVVNGVVSSKVEYTYILYPQRPGTFTLGPFTITRRGQAVTSNTITVTVTQTSSRQERQTDDIFVTADVDVKQPYVNQQIICTFQFCRSVNVANANLTEQPSFEGFIVEDLGKPTEYQKLINGKHYVITEIKKALFPVRSGVLEIGQFTLQCDVVVQKSRRRGFFQDPFFNDPFFGFTETMPKTLRTTPVQVMVRPLPSEGRPADFKNLVGTYTLEAALGKQTVTAGESATLTITLSGNGNLKNITGIDLPLLDNVKVYDDKPVYEQKVSQGRIGGMVTFKKAIVPLVPGDMTIPPVSVSFFDPIEGVYKKATTQPFRLSVAPGTGIEQPVAVNIAPENRTVKQDVAVIGRDIMPIHTSPRVLNPRFQRLHTGVILVLFLTPILFFLLFTYLQALRAKAAQDTAAIRARKAYGVFKKSLHTLKQDLRSDGSLFYQHAAKAFKDFIGDKLGITGAALTSSELRDILRRSGVDEKTAEEAARLLESFDAGQFGITQHTAGEKEQAYNSLKHLARALDKTLKKPLNREQIV